MQNLWQRFDRVIYWILIKTEGSHTGCTGMGMCKTVFDVMRRWQRFNSWGTQQVKGTAGHTCLWDHNQWGSMGVSQTLVEGEGIWELRLAKLAFGVTSLRIKESKIVWRWERCLLDKVGYLCAWCLLSNRKTLTEVLFWTWPRGTEKAHTPIDGILWQCTWIKHCGFKQQYAAPSRMVDTLRSTSALHQWHFLSGVPELDDGKKHGRLQNLSAMFRQRAKPFCFSHQSFTTDWPHC